MFDLRCVEQRAPQRRLGQRWRVGLTHLTDGCVRELLVSSSCDSWRRRFRHAPSVPRGGSRGLRRDAGAYSGNPGAACGGPRRPARASSRALRALGDLPVPGPAFGDFLPGRRFGFPLRPIAGASRSHLEPLKAGNGSPPLLALHRYRATQASWISSPPLGSPSRRRSLPREGRIDPRPVADRRRSDNAPGRSTRG